MWVCRKGLHDSAHRTFCNTLHGPYLPPYASFHCSQQRSSTPGRSVFSLSFRQIITQSTWSCCFPWSLSQPYLPPFCLSLVPHIFQETAISSPWKLLGLFQSTYISIFHKIPLYLGLFHYCIIQHYAILIDSFIFPGCLPFSNPSPKLSVYIVLW